MKAPEQPASHLVRRVVVGVVHVRADRPGGELVGERVAGEDRVLGDVRDAVHVVRDALPVEVDPRRFGQVVLEDRPDPVALHDLDPRARPRAVEPEGRDRILDRVDLVLDLVDGHLVDLDAVLDPRRRQGLVARAGERRALAVEEPLDDREGRRVVVGRRGRPGWRGRGRRLVARVLVGGRGGRRGARAALAAAAGALDDFGG